MLKLGKLTDYAVVLLAAMARENGKTHAAASLASSTGIPLATTAKLLKLMAKSNIVVSLRGAQGGYRLQAEAASLNLTTIIEAVEGPIALTTCAAEEQGSCAYDSRCSLHGKWTSVNSAVRSALMQVKLSDLQPVVAEAAPL